MAYLFLVRRMKRFRNAVIAVLVAFAITYGVLVFIIYRNLLSQQLHPTTSYPPKFPPEAAWIFAAVDSLIIFIAIAIIGFVITVVSTFWQFLRSRHREHSM